MLPIKFGIVGGFQAGKSTLINCLLGENVATVGDGRSTTHTIVNYLFSKNEHIEIEYIWGDSESFKLENSEKIPDNTSSILDEAIRYTPKIQFGVVSTQNNWGVSKDVNFDAYISNWVVLKGCDFFEGDEFKIRANNDWNINYGMPDTQEFGGIKEGVKYTLVLNGKNIIAPVDDSYNIYFNVATKELCVMREGTIPIVKAINVYLDNQFLRIFSLVDMPGYGFNEEDNRLAECAISLIDYAIVVMTNHKAIGGEDSKLFSVIQLLKQRKVPYYFCVNCTDENKYKWSPDNRLNVDIYNESVFHLNSYLPLACPDDDVIPIVNFMWYWYSQYPEDPIFEEYKNLLFAYDLLDNNRSLKEIERYSNFHLIEKIFSMENRMYLELKKEIKEEIQKLKDEVCPVGTIQAFAFNRIPDGWMICDGRWLHILDYPELFGAIGHSFGKVDENSFKIPDLRGRFIRGWSEDGEIDKGRKLGSLQEDSLQGHSHKVQFKETLMTEADGSHRHDSYYSSYTYREGALGKFTANEVGSSKKYNGTTQSLEGAHCHYVHLPENFVRVLEPKSIQEFNDVVRLADETRPTNVALLYCIKTGIHSEARFFSNLDGDIVENPYADIDQE